MGRLPGWAPALLISCVLPSRCAACARRAEVLGIHGNPVRSIPLFLVYLSTLFHTYSLATRYAAGGMAATSASSASAAPGAQAPDLEAGTAAVGQEGGAPALRPRSRSSGSTAEQFLGETLGSSVSGSLQRIGLRLLEGCYSGERRCMLLQSWGGGLSCVQAALPR